jgi:DNA-directed RNA polymerase subunit F
MRLAAPLRRAIPLVLALGLARCSGCDKKALEGGGAVAADAGSPTSQLTPEQASKVLARVGDRTITLGDYVAALEHMDQFDRLRYQSPERRKELLDEMIDVELLAREAEAKGYDKDPVAQQELRAILRDAVLKDARKDVPLPSDIPEKEVRDYYEAHKADYVDPERRRVSCIVLRDEATAKAVLADAKGATAARWGELVRARSIDVAAKANVPTDLAGDFGMVSPPGDPKGENPRVPEPVRAAVFEIGAVGDVLDRVVPGGDGRFYVVRLAQKTEPHARAFAEAERSIRVKLAQDKIKAREEALLAELKKEVPVQIDEAALAAVKVDWPDAGASP